MVGVAAVALALAGYARHWLLWSNLYDLGIFDQALYLLSRGLPPVSTTLGFAILGDHAAFILYPLAWLYRLRPSVVWLFVIQGVALAAGAWPVARLAGDLGLPRPWQRSLAAAYLLYPAVCNVALYDFHPEVLAVPALLWACVWGFEGRLAPFLAALVWAASCKEMLGLTIAGLGLWLLAGIRDQRGAMIRRSRFGALAIGFGLSWFAFDACYVIPHFSGHTLAAVNRYGYLGGPSLAGLIEGTLRNPQLVITHLVAPGFLLYLAMLVAPLALGPSWRDIAALLPAAPMLLLNALSRVPYQRDLLHQYTVPIFPFLLVWLVLGVSRAQAEQCPRRLAWRRGPGLRPRYVVAMAAVGFLALAKYGYFATVFRTHLDYRRAALEAMRQIPPGASVLAASDLCPHLTHRVRIDQPQGGPPPLDPAGWVSTYRFILLDPQQAAVDPGKMPPEVFRAVLQRKFSVRFRKDGVTLLERRPHPSGRLAASAGGLTL